MYSEISQSYMMRIDIITLTANRMCACVFFCFKFFSVLSSSMIIYNPHKQKLFRVLRFVDVLRPKILRTTALEL